ncbi:MAG: 30S ribosomal protein S14, partial [Gammaproteobacteria bacterium HGW-Gammaproteobacteria-8]
MAKKSMIARDLKRVELAGKYAAKRAELKRIIADQDVGFEEKQA